jgi:ribosomal protein S18 acetylase RimI-like enzyme
MMAGHEHSRSVGRAPGSESHIRVTTYHEAYRADFARLNLEWIERHFWVEERDRTILRDPWTEVIARGGEIFFALDEDQVVGTVAMRPAGPWTYELTKMAVRPMARGRGFGLRLLDRAMAWARDRGARRVILYSHTSLRPALSLYRRRGFRTVRLGPTPGYERSDIEMVRDLEPPGSGRADDA